jgi:hypothetical protein
MTELNIILDAIQRGGMPFIVLLILYGGYKEIWVWGRQLKAAEAREEEWKRMVLRSTDLATRATNTAAGAVSQQLVGR